MQKVCFIICGEIMRIPQIKFSIDKNNRFSNVRKSFNNFCTKADRIMNPENKITGLLPASMKKNKDTNPTTTQLIDLVLRNI